MRRTIVMLIRGVTLPVFFLSLLLIGSSDNLKADIVTVEMLGGPGQGDFRFSPEEVRIKVGDTIIWVNNSPSGISHTATYGLGSDDPRNGFFFDTGFLQPGESYEVTFDKMGTYHYYCIPHEFFDMVGVIHVGSHHRVPEFYER